MLVGCAVPSDAGREGREGASDAAGSPWLHACAAQPFDEGVEGRDRPFQQRDEPRGDEGGVVGVLHQDHAVSQQVAPGSLDGAGRSGCGDQEEGLEAALHFFDDHPDGDVFLDLLPQQELDLIRSLDALDGGRDLEALRDRLNGIVPGKEDLYGEYTR